MLAGPQGARGDFWGGAPIPRMTEMHRLSRRHPWSFAMPLAACVIGAMTTSAPSALAADAAGDAAAETPAPPTAQPAPPAVSKSRGIPLHSDAAGWGASI